MRQTISGLVAAIAVMTASAVPAMACGGGLFQGSCSPCGQAYVEPCAQSEVYAAPALTLGYSGCNTGCGGWGFERLPDPVHQYYYVNQGPTYSGPGSFAPYRTYEENSVSGWSAYRQRPRYYGYGASRYDAGPAYSYRARPWRARTGYEYSMRPSIRYGYGPRRSYAPRFYASRHSMRYGAPMDMPRAYGYRGHTLRRYY
jgi:hypothetical protein